MKKQINFWGYKQEYYEFSNFFRAPIKINDVIWPTSEHYYQAMKFKGQTMMYTGREVIVTELVRSLASPRTVCEFCRNPLMNLREDWEEVKEDYMYKALQAKFSDYNYELKHKLIQTDNADIVEDSPIDYYWGCGKDRSGQNRLGVLLMRLRWDITNNYSIIDDINPFTNYEWSCNERK
jgi:ribA/ribD-fused uncharacterized protein